MFAGQDQSCHPCLLCRAHDLIRIECGRCEHRGRLIAIPPFFICKCIGGEVQKTVELPPMPAQLAWRRYRPVRLRGSHWKICRFSHTLYSCAKRLRSGVLSSVAWNTLFDVSLSLYTTKWAASWLTCRFAYGPEPGLGCHHCIKLFDSLMPNALTHAEGLPLIVLS